MKQFFINLGLTLLGILSPIKPLMITVGVLIFMDLITGIWAARKRGEAITSAAMRRTISKMLIYQICLISGFLVEKYLLEGLIPASKLIASVMGVVELKSVLENANTITGMNLFKELIGRLGSKNDGNPPSA